MRGHVAILLCLLLLALAAPLRAQVLPGGTPAPGAPLFPESACAPGEVAVGMSTAGVLICSPLTPAILPGVALVGGDINTASQIIATHLANPLPLAQGGLGLIEGTSGGLPYFSSPTTLASSGALPLGMPVLGGGVGQAPTTGTVTGTTARFATVLGPLTPNTQLTFDANGNLIASSVAVGGAGVVSVFGRTGPVVALPGDYTAAQVTNAADLTAANVFGHPAGQSMRQLVLAGSVTGALHLQPAPNAGASTLIFPAGSTDFSTTGGVHQVLTQFTVGGPLQVQPLTFADLSGPLDFSQLTGVALPTQVPPLQDLRGVATASQVPALPGLAGILPPAKGGLGWTDTTFTGSAHQLATVTGTLATGWCVTVDANGNLVTTGAPCTTPGNTGTVASGAAGNLAFYGATGTTLSDSGLAVAVLVTAPSPFTAGHLLQAAGATRTASDSGIAVSALCTTVGVCAGYQAALGYTAESQANKSTVASLGLSDTLYPSQGAVKSYVDTQLAGKQASLGFTPENLANKSTSTVLGPSNTLYPSQAAVKLYVDTGLAAKQDLVTWGAGLTLTGSTASVLSTKPGFLTNGGGTALVCGIGAAGTMQVLANGEVQYCDGASTTVLHSGVPTQSGLTWNVVPGGCTGDGNAGKLTIDGSNRVVCAADIGGAGGGGGVSSVFGRTGAVVAQPGDYSAAQVTNAADLTAANVFLHATGQSMKALLLVGASSGVLTVKGPAVGGASALTFPAGVTDFSATGGTGRVVQQSTAGGPFTVGQLTASDLNNGTTGGSAIVLANAPTLQNPTIAALANLPTNGLVRTSGGNGTLVVDPALYLTANQAITVTGDASGTGTTTIALVVSKLNSVAFAGSAGHLVAFGAGNSPSDSGLPLGSVCTTAGVCAGYQAALGASPQFTSLGLGGAAPVGAGQLALTATANALTLLTLKRGTDTSPAGAFETFQTAAGVALWTVDSTGVLTVGIVPGARVQGNISGQAATALALAAAPTLCAPGLLGAGINASGNAQGCTAVVTSLTGTPNRLVVTPGTGGSQGLDLGSDAATLSGLQTFLGVKTFSGLNLGTNTLRTQYPNDAGTGTTNGLLAKLLPGVTPGTVQRAAVSDVGVLGVTVSGGGTSGTAQVATGGQVLCTFENAVTAGNMVLVGTGTAGTCRDAGTPLVSLIPSYLQILGQAIESGAAGPRLIQLRGPGHYGTLVHLGIMVTDILPVANGGSGAASLTGVLVGNGTAPFTAVALPAGALVGTTAVQDLSGKRYIKRVVPYAASAGQVQLLSDSTDIATISSLSSTTLFLNPTGSPVDGQVLVVRIKTATAITVTWDTQFRGSTTAPLPAVTSGGGLEDYFAYIRNTAANKWDFQTLNKGF